MAVNQDTIVTTAIIWLIIEPLIYQNLTIKLYFWQSLNKKLFKID